MKTFRIYLAKVSLLLILSSTSLSFADYTDLHDKKGMLKNEKVHDASNTKNNVIDKDRETVLPENQSNKAEFLERTAAIRKDIISNDSLSVNAHNIKIVTLDTGTVVLRGPVDSEKEKKFIESVAAKYVPRDAISSFVEVDKQSN